MSLVTLDQKLERLCSRDSEIVQPLVGLTVDEATALRTIFVVQGWDYAMTVPGMSSLLNEIQFRGADQGRGPGMREVLGEDLEKLLELCLTLSKGTKHRIINSIAGEPKEGTEGRGLQQSAADIISLAVVGAGTVSNKYVERLNKRVLRWWAKGIQSKRVSDTEFKLVASKFAPLEIPSAKMTSVEPEHLWQIWLFLTGRRSVE